MSRAVIRIENISKQYRLGKIGTGSFAHDVNRLWHKMRGKEDPYLRIGEENDRTRKGDSEYVWALRDVSFDVMQGEVLGIVGRNGAGKSTLLKILSRTTSPTTGNIKIKGRIASLLEVGTGFHPELTGKENIFLNGAILGMTKREIKSKFDEIVDFAGVEKYIDTPVKRYSSGMYVRLAFAVAAHLDPEILIVDEVLAVGDAEFQKKAMGKMQDVSRGQGRTVLFVSHNMGAIKSLCTNGVFMKNGTVVMKSSIEDVVTRYLHNEETLKIPLAQRTDRIGNGNLKFTDIRFTNLKNEDIASVFTGQAFKIILEYDCSIPDFNTDLLIINIEFSNEFGQQLSFFVSDEMQKTIVKNGKREIHLVIHRLMLRGGEYSIKLFSSYSSTSPSDFCDVIENAGELSVMSTDFWLKDRVIRSIKGAVMEAEYQIYN
ncbi:ABC transporter ATP-binding protein [Ohtaekwangia sp.]|uniref:ABC transporter ATP-binding protein n=1 Tax=Ohtaekwangia sp. TaxID=2066019 RepID=UPI002FDE6FB4